MKFIKFIGKLIVLWGIVFASHILIMLILYYGFQISVFPTEEGSTAFGNFMIFAFASYAVAFLLSLMLFIDFLKELFKKDNKSVTDFEERI